MVDTNVFLDPFGGGMAPLAPSTAAGQIAGADGSGGWGPVSGISLTGGVNPIISATNALFLTGASVQVIAPFYPSADNIRPLGLLTRRWSSFYAAGISFPAAPTTDAATGESVISGVDALPAATTNLVGGDLTISAGDGASGSAGLANGGTTKIYEGVGYGTGVNGGVIVGTSAGHVGFFDTTPAAQQSHVADPAGGATVDSEARTAINSILATLETFGLHAAA